VLTPIGIHRRLSGRHVKGRLVTAAHQIMNVVLGAIAVLIVASSAFVFDVVAGGLPAAGAGAALGVVVVALLVVLPRALVSHP